MIALTCRELLARLRREESGLAMTEFAFVAPILLSLGLVGTELANYVVTHMRVSQIAMQVADNASRIGEHNVLVERKVYERDINDMLIGADKLAGNLAIFERGRIIVSSLQQNADGGQWIKWQRCRGKKRYNSSYGKEDDGKTGKAFPGMGDKGKEITASPGNAVMFVEVAYDYPALTPISLYDKKLITYTASFNVRDARDLSQLYDTPPVATKALCSSYTG